MVEIKKEKVLLKPEDLKPSDEKLKVVGTFNPGAARLKDGNIILYVRVAEKLVRDESDNFYYSPRCFGTKKCKVVIDKFQKKDVESKSDVDIVFKNGTKRLTYISHLRKVILDDSGIKIKSIDEYPSFSGIAEDGELGVEDARITKFKDKYYMTYVALSRLGNVSTNLAVSKDCINWKRKGTMFREQNKDVVLFPEKVNGKFVAFNRPEGNFQFTSPKIWISFSNDLKLWGESKPIKLSETARWDCAKTGAGPPPIKTNRGWLLIYHSVNNKIKKGGYFEVIKKIFGKEETSSTYSVGVALFDLKKPYKLIAKSSKAIINPTKEYEKKGFVENVIFPTGVITTEDNSLLLYSGGGDRVTTVREIRIKEIMKSLKKISF